MSVDEMIARLPELGVDERRRLREALDRAEAGAGESEETLRRRGEAAWDRLLNGLVEGSRTDLSQHIDEAIYGSDR